MPRIRTWRPGRGLPLLPGGIGRSTRVPWYLSDMSDAEWRVIEPALPVPAWKAGKGPALPALPPRLRGRDPLPGQGGHPWRAMPRTCRTGAPSTTWPTARTERGHRKMHDELRRQCRISAGRTPEPTAAVIDSQSVKAAEEVSRPPAYDAGKKVSGRKPHIAVDTIGSLLTVLITAAAVQDRDGASRPLEPAPGFHSVSLPGPTPATPTS